ncbi:polyketide synthase dehydratase-domain-containing protein [Xylariomycetidae sp. FL0641]|nr:polyketide synthase dehydratase-domain-containing protein [Xylariomycetidae sp. FL0641]
MVSVVLAVAQQILETGKTTRAFKLREISFVAAMALLEETATELTVHLRPHLLATAGTTPATWWEFTVSSCVGPAGTMGDNCRGLISIVYAEDSSGASVVREDAAAEAASIADYGAVRKECAQAYSKEFFCDRWRSSFMQYGEAFQGDEMVRPGAGQTCYDVRVVDIGESLTRGKLGRPFLVRPATLDAAWQGWIGSTCRDRENAGNFGLNRLMLPTVFGELDTNANIPADVGRAMPCVCRSHGKGPNKVSVAIDTFDENLSTALMSLKDFRLSQVEMEEAEQDGPDIDPAGITSEVRWNYALDVMKPSEIRHAVSSAGVTSADEPLILLLEMAVHQRPAAKVVELVQSSSNLPGTIVPRLSKNTILPTQVRYAIIGGDVPDVPVVNDAVGVAFELYSSDAPSPVTFSPADLFFIPGHASAQSEEELEGTVEQLFRKVKLDDGALVAMVASSAATDVASEIFKPRGFEVFDSMPAGSGQLIFCRRQGKSIINGTHPTQPRQGVTILEPGAPSLEVQTLAKQLGHMLEEYGYTVTMQSDLPHQALNDKACISLLELDNPVLGTLSEAEFHSLRSLWASSERRLWLTRGDNPLLGMVDGMYVYPYGF